ncbi:MAG: DUF4168 domain-containing protein [Caulobacteraceae bacterium]|nr:DUF4168 domain-containing protein [Caulobacteraceae bacterium]
MRWHAERTRGNQCSNAAKRRSTTTSSTAQSTQPATFTDAQLRAYAAARDEMAPLQATFGTQTPERQQQIATEIAAIQQRHGIEPSMYNQIARRANEDRTFAARLAGVQLIHSATTRCAFARASIEIQPLTAGLSTATPEQQAQITEQIRQILERNNLDSATYNAIAQRAQTDQAFAARVQDLYRQAQAPATNENNGE